MTSREKLNKIILILGDGFIFYGALFLALIIRFQSWPEEKIWQPHLLPFSILFVLWLLIFYITGLYDLKKFISFKELRSVLIRTMALAGGLAILLFYLVPFFGITPKTNLVLDIGVSLGFLIIWRRFFFAKLLKAEKIKMLFFGLTRETAAFASFINQNPQIGYETAAIMKLPGENENSFESSAPVLEFDHNIVSLIKEKSVSLIVASSSIKQNKELIRMFYEVLPLGITIIDFPRFYEGLTGKVPVSLINEVWFLENLTELDKYIFEIIKRWFDVIFSLLLSVPALLAAPFAALLIKLESPGPVFYFQKRIGKNGRIFEIIKFRSMKANAETNGARWAEKNDNRVTASGRFLRKTRIDELPQLWNVLKGELSLIGPRPERPEFTETLKKEISHYAMRHLIKPGLSGWAQINFPYGASKEDAMEKLQYDLFYIKNRSLTLDLDIFLKTLATIFRHQGR
ncbi:MAG: exopolysaccharide biosynthesis polyprenyl glycosylphosphotransferase [Patescibacteria group bacterium]